MGSECYQEFLGSALRKLARQRYRNEPYVLGLVELAEAIEIRSAFPQVPTQAWIECWLSTYEAVLEQREDPALDELLEAATEPLTRASFVARLPFLCSFLVLADVWSHPQISMQVLLSEAHAKRYLHAITMALRWAVRWIQPTLLGRRTFISGKDGIALLRLLLPHAETMNPLFVEELAALAAVYRLDTEKEEVLALLEQTAPESYSGAVEMIAEDIDRGAYETAMLEYDECHCEADSPLDYVPGSWPRNTRSEPPRGGSSGSFSSTESNYWELNRFIQL